MEQIVIALVILIIGYRIYLRVRRSVGWQQLQPRKLLFSTVLLSVVGALFLIAGGFSIASLLSDLAGLCIGGLLAYYSAATTRFQYRDGHIFYSTSAWINFSVLALFFGRLVYRFYELLWGPLAGLKDADTLASIGNSSSPWLSGLMLIMFVYYVGFNIALMRKKHKLSAKPA